MDFQTVMIISRLSRTCPAVIRLDGSVTNNFRMIVLVSSDTRPSSGMEYSADFISAKRDVIQGQVKQVKLRLTMTSRAAERKRTSG